MKKIIIVLFVISNLFFRAFPQPDTIQSDKDLKDLSRYRLSVGYVDLWVEDTDWSFSYPFLNLSFRSCRFDRTSSTFKVKWAFETGINGLIIAPKNSNSVADYNFYILPYAKFGPDLRIYKNIFLSGCLGLALATYGSGFAPLPFFGVNGFYVYLLNDNLSLDFETGFHSTYSPNKLPLLFYITVGVALM